MGEEGRVFDTCPTNFHDSAAFLALAERPRHARQRLVCRDGLSTVDGMLAAKRLETVKVLWSRNSDRYRIEVCAPPRPAAEPGRVTCLHRWRRLGSILRRRRKHRYVVLNRGWRGGDARVGQIGRHGISREIRFRLELANAFRQNA